MKFYFIFIFEYIFIFNQHLKLRKNNFENKDKLNNKNNEIKILLQKKLELDNDNEFDLNYLKFLNSKNTILGNKYCNYFLKFYYLEIKNKNTNKIINKKIKTILNFCKKTNRCYSKYYNLANKIYQKIEIYKSNKKQKDYNLYNLVNNLKENNKIKLDKNEILLYKYKKIKYKKVLRRKSNPFHNFKINKFRNFISLNDSNKKVMKNFIIKIGKNYKKYKKECKYKGKNYFDFLDSKNKIIKNNSKKNKKFNLFLKNRNISKKLVLNFLKKNN